MQRTTVSPIRVGCSGWVYKHWRGIFYPEGLAQRLWLDRYSQEFDTVEINNSFYRLPEKSTFVNWSRRSPAGFLFAVKASRYLTHQKRLNAPGPPRAAERKYSCWMPANNQSLPCLTCPAWTIRRWTTPKWTTQRCITERTTIRSSSVQGREQRGLRNPPLSRCG